MRLLVMFYSPQSLFPAHTMLMMRWLIDGQSYNLCKTKLPVILNKPSMALPVEYQTPFKPVFLNICVVKEPLSLNLFFRLHA